MTRNKFAAVGVFWFSAFAASGATISVYMGAPGVVTSPFTGPNSITETFDSLATGNRTTDYVSPIGIYHLTTTAPFNIQSSNQYGGAGGTNYMTIGAQSGTSAPITLDFGRKLDYFGFWWSAGDGNNGLSFYLAGVLLARFSTADLVAILSPKATGTVTAMNGTVYNDSSYYGKPGTGQNTGEAYAYVMFKANGIQFDTIVFDNSGSTGTGFENDNHNIYLSSVVIPGDSVLVKNVGSSIANPEPATLGVTGVGLLAGAWIVKRRRATWEMARRRAQG